MRSMSCLRLTSRWGVPTAPRKYLLVTMLTAFTDQKSGNSTPRCSKLTEPSRQLVMTTSRRAQATSSYGCTPGVVWMRSMRRPLFAAALVPLARELRAGPLAVSVMPPPCTGENALKCPDVPVARCSVWYCGHHSPPPATGLRSPPSGRPGSWPGPARRSVGGAGGLGELSSPSGPAIVFPAPRGGLFAVRSLSAVLVVRGGGSRLPQFRDGRIEVLERVERPVDGGESQIRDEIELLQRAEYGQPHVVGGQLGAPGGPHRLLDPLAELGERVLGDRSSLACLAHTVDDLGTAERLGDSGPLDHHQRARLHGRETTGAVRTLAAPADRRAVVGRTTVDDAAVGVPAEGAVHGFPTLLTADSIAPLGHMGPSKQPQA